MPEIPLIRDSWLIILNKCTLGSVKAIYHAFTQSYELVQQFSVLKGGRKISKVFINFAKRFCNQLPMWGKGVPTPTSNSLTAAGCPTIQANSDTIYQEVESDPTG